MTESPETRPSWSKRQQEEWAAALRRQEEMLRALPDRELDALVAAAAFGDPAFAVVPFSTGWNGLGRIVEHLRERGYTMQLYSFEQDHLDWMNKLPGHIKRGETYGAGEVTVVDIRHRLPLPPSWPNLRVRADNVPRATAIAAVLIHQIEQGALAPPAPQPDRQTPTGGWTEERRRQKSEQMRKYWQRKRDSVGSGPKGDVRP